MSAAMQPVLLNLGAALHVPGLMALLTLPVCFLASEPYAVPGLLAIAALSLLGGQVLYRVAQLQGLACAVGPKAWRGRSGRRPTFWHAGASGRRPPVEQIRDSAEVSRG